jgi:DNA-directed RNA polymerase subunit L
VSINQNSFQDFISKKRNVEATPYKMKHVKDENKILQFFVPHKVKRFKHEKVCMQKIVMLARKTVGILVSLRVEDERDRVIWWYNTTVGMEKSGHVSPTPTFLQECFV